MSSDQPDSVVESLRLERLHVQKKTFSKWANIYLQKFGLQIDDLFQDMGDGLKLMKLLESLSGEKLGKPAIGNSRIKRIENVSRCLMFLHSKKMRLENISSEDIVDGKPHLILGLLWMIILRYEIPPEGPPNVPEDVPPPPVEQMRQVPNIAKESLLLWCQTKTNGYPRVHVRDFHKSWRDGLAFNALIHSHVPTLVDFNALKQPEHVYNLENAFSVAQKHIGVPRLLDPEDVDTDNPDERSILVYVSTFCKGLGKYRDEMTGGKRISYVMKKSIDCDKLKRNYTGSATELLNWIYSKVKYFESQEKLESLEEIQKQIAEFKTYRTEEKPLQYEKKNEVEVLYFSIQMKRLGQNGWVPPEKVSPAAIEKAWSELQRAEHTHEINLRSQLKEQERLENLAYKFESKRAVREGYINEIQKILTDPNYGASLKQSDATFKKHEAIRTGIIAREIMIQDLFKISEVLIESNYRRKDTIIVWKKETEEKWKYLLRLLEAFDEKFSYLREVISTLEEMDSILEEMQQLQAELDTETEPLDVSSSLQKHALKEVQIASWAEAVHRFEKKVENQKKIKDINILQTQVKKLRNTHESLTEASRNRRQMLEEQIKLKEHEENVEEILAWIFEKQLYCTADVYCKDLASSLLLQKNHKALGSKISLQKEIIENMGEERLKSAIQELEEQYKEKEKYIAIAVEAYQYICDADECASWISENMHLLSTLDYGTDDLTCEALLRRHAHMEEKIKAHSVEIKSLREVAEKLRDSLQKIPKPRARRHVSSGRSSINDAIFSPEDFIKNCCLYSDNIHKRQMEIENKYEKLQSKSKKRKIRLHQSYMFFNFKDRCDEIEKWMREKEKIMDSNDFGNEEEEVEKHFEKFLTDMVAHGLIIEELGSTVKQLEEGEAEQAKTAKMLLDDIKRRWNHLNQLTRIKEQNLKGYTSLLLAHRMCESSITFLNETLLSTDIDSVDKITSFDELRRKQEAIGRELNIAEERVKQALVLSEKVSGQDASLQNRVQVLKDNWKQFKIETREKQKRIEKEASIQIFSAKANYLIEWSNDMQCKLRMREKISDLEVAQNVSKDHKDLGNEIEIQDYRFTEIQELGSTVCKMYPEYEPLLQQLSEAKKIVRELWEEKYAWISQNLDLQIFDREANHLQSICANQNTLLDVAELGENLSDMEILIRHHDSFMDTLRAQTGRFALFNEMAEKLLDSSHEQKNYIRSRQEEIYELREGVLQKANERSLRLQQEYLLQEFKVDAHEMMTWIAEKNKRSLDLHQSGNTINLSSKIKRLETLEAELTVNHDQLQNAYAKGEKLSEECSFAKDTLENILEDLESNWNLLCERLDLIRKNIYRDKELEDFNSSVLSVGKKLAEIKLLSESPNFGNDYRSVKNMLKMQESLEKDDEKSKEKVSNLILQGRKLIEELNCDQMHVQTSISELDDKLVSIEKPLMARREKLETCMKFYQFKSEVERELMWISDQIILLSADTPCQNLLEAQKLQKKLENLEVTLDCHQKIVENLSKEVLVLVAEKECIVDITRTCEIMEEEWKKLLEIFYDKKTKINFTVKAQMFYSEATEIDSWITEKKQILSSTDCGKDEDMVIKLLTKQKDIELEIDSYKGLVEELAHQAETLIELKHPDSKIIKNRMEAIEQDMKVLQNLCLTRRQKLLESKQEREFDKETEELDIWISEQMTHATSEDYGEDYEHVLMIHTNFEFYRARVEAGSKRIIQYEDFARRLINSKCQFTDKVNKSLELLSSRWSELLESLEARAFKLEAAAEIHRYHRDVTDVLGRIHSYYRALPNDLGSSLAQAQQLAKKHDAIENELLGIEAQLHLLVEDSRRLQEAYPGGNEEHIQMQLALVIENWNSLQQKVASRKENLIAAQRIHKFFSLIREEETWSKQMCFELESNNMPRDLEQIGNQHHITEMEIETRLSKYEALRNDGESLLVYDLFHKQIDEKLQTLSEVENRVKNAWSARCSYITKTKAVILFFNEAKQIQASLATREVQLCGSETKETVEGLESALKKHLEFQKTVKIHEDKFSNWEQQGNSLLKERVPESERIGRKLEELSSRRKRLSSFSTERCDAYSNALRLAKFKRDTIEVESWIKEKKNKLRTLLKDYTLLNADEKIKCLQKQQSLQAEIEAHEPIIQRIIQQKRDITSAGEELNVRVELILENWNEVKGNADRIGQDLKEAQDMLIMHDYFEKAESWIKEKELLIQKNDAGKDYEHCASLQMKLDDHNSGTKVDDAFIHNMRLLAEKLSRKENNGVYVRYERINDRWEFLKEEMTHYRRKLTNAAEVHAFVKDMDDTIDRIREKSMFLSAKQEVYDLTATETMRRKLEAIEKDLTAIDKKLKEQCFQGNYLAELHELSAGRIYDKMNQAEREWAELQKELNRKKKHMDAVYTSFKFVKDVDDTEKIISDIIKEMEYGAEPSDSADAISLLQAHQDDQAQVKVCLEKIKSLEEYGENVLKTPGVLIEEIGNSIKTLHLISESIQMSWDYRLNLLTKLRDVHIFSEKAKQIETWFASKEAFLANEDVGDSMSSVEALIRKQENFVKTCTTYFEKLHELETLASNIRKYEDCDDIEKWFSDICNRRDRLLEACKKRNKILNDSKTLQQMLLGLYEVSNWMNEKIRLVSDESDRDLTNLMSKIQKHATLEAEILANHSRVVSITTQADDLLRDSHFASDDIRQHIQNLDDTWQKLMDLTNEKKVKLNDAYNALKFKQKLEDINTWLDETESQLQFESYAVDVLSIQEEIEKIRDINKDMTEISEKLRILSDATEKFEHFSKEDILKEFRFTEERFRTVDDSIALKFSRLQDELSLAGLEKDINDELSWIEDNIAVCQSEDYFDDVLSVQVLQKKLQALETEMQSREPLINSLVERGNRLNNPNAEATVIHLEKRFQEFKDSISLRRLRLSDALECQTYYFEVAQAEIWMKEKLAQVSSCDRGIDMHSVQEMMKRLISIEAATNGFKQNIDSVEQMSLNLVGRGHYDSQNIQIKQEELNNRYEELTCTILKKIAILREEEEFFSYHRDVNIIISQLKTMTATTNNTDVGRDLEHVESLLQKLELLRGKLCSHQKTVENLQQKASSLIDGGHSESNRIKQLLADLEDAWLQCDYSAETRYKLLEEGKVIHSFRKSAEDTKSWICEKDYAFNSQDFGHDLQSTETLLRHHETLEGDLKAIQEQVEALRVESATLSEQYPNSKDILEDKLLDVTNAYGKCVEKAAERKEKLLQAEQLQSYFEEARDFQAWIRETSAMISQIDLPHDVATCEAVLAHYDEFFSEIQEQRKSLKEFETRSHKFIACGHFMASEIEEKLQNLKVSFENLCCCWRDKRTIHERNLDLQLFYHNLKEMESWIQGQEYQLAEEYGRSLEEVDYLIRKHEQFEEKLKAYEQKFEKLLEITKLEEEIKNKKEGEKQEKEEQMEQEKQKKFEEIKRKEEARLLEERRKEREQIEMPQIDESHDDLAPKEGFSPIFKHYDSKRRFPDKNQHQISPRPHTPVISKKLSVSLSAIPPTSAEGFLQRKHEFASGGKKSASRGWKNFYTVLCGQLLCFFKDKKAFVGKQAAKPPINILGARCSIPNDYRKKKNVFRLEPTDSSSFLFEAPNDIKMNDWMQKLNYIAALPPSMQLMMPTDERDSMMSYRKGSAFSTASEYDISVDMTERAGTSSAKRNERGSVAGDSLYDDITHNFDTVSNPIYEVPYQETIRSSTLTSYDEALQSARSSLSEQSYQTAIAGSSTSTLQDEQIESSEDDVLYSMPENLSRAKSEMVIDSAEHERAKKQMSLPKNIGAQRPERKSKWNVFSLRRKQSNS